MTLISLSLLVATLAIVRGMPTGPPIGMEAQRISVCSNLVPTTGSPHIAQKGTNGYRVRTNLPLNSTVNMYQYSAGGQYEVTIEGNMFRGFLMQARDPMDMAIGTFQTTTASQQLLDCSAQAGIGAEATIAHSNSARADFPYQTFNWTAPAGGDGYVVLRYTLVPQSSQYFGPLTSPPLVQAPTRAPADYPITRRFPDGCTPSACDIFVGMALNTADNNYVDIYMEGTADVWVASGFSLTQNMFSADVVTCVVDSSNSMVVGQDTYNAAANTRNNIIDTTSNIVFFSGSSTNGRISCTLAKEIYGTAVPNQDLNLNQDLFLLYARGNSRRTGNEIGGHAGGPTNRAATAAVNVPLNSTTTQAATQVATQGATQATTGGSVTMTTSLLCLFISSIVVFLKV